MKKKDMFINENKSYLRDFTYEYAMLLMAQQMLDVYNIEGSCYNDPINADTNREQIIGYFNIALDRIKGKKDNEIFKMISDIGNLNGFDKN